MKSKKNKTFFNFFSSKEKKAITLPGMMIGLVIAVIILAVMAMIFGRGAGKSSVIISKEFEKFGDCDCDDVRNFIDKCPCIPFEEGNENLQAKGCPAGTKATSCSKENCTKAKNESFRCAS